jgi:dihydrodipicolinate synthase/N-acetylneuraminate lyase
MISRRPAPTVSWYSRSQPTKAPHSIPRSPSSTTGGSQTSDFPLSLGGVVFDEPTLRSLLLLDGVIAIKEASFNALTFRNTVRIVRDTRPEITVLTGDDNFMFESFLLGADGGLLGFAAIMTRQMVDMIEAWHRGDPTEARRIGEPCQELADLLFAPPVSKYRARIKAALSLTGVLDIGSTFVREPLRPLAEADRIAVEAAVRRAGLLTGVHA